MHGVDGRHGHDDESNSTVTHCLVLGGADGEDQKTECVVSSIIVDNGSVGVELYGCSFDFFVRWLVVLLVEGGDFGMQKQRLVTLVGRHDGDEAFQLCW